MTTSNDHGAPPPEARPSASATAAATQKQLDDALQRLGAQVASTRRFLSQLGHPMSVDAQPTASGDPPEAPPGEADDGPEKPVP